MQLRDYQESISTDAAKMLAVLKICYLSMMPRTGKTLTALAAADKYGAKWVLFLTKKKAISSITADYDKLGPAYKLICTNYEQVYNLSPSYEFDLVILDEAHSCFIAGTLIDGKPIESLRVDDMVNSYNESINALEKKRVIRVIKRKLDKRLLKLKVNGQSVICTEDHRFFTKRGWIEARYLTTEDELYCL